MAAARYQQMINERVLKIKEIELSVERYEVTGNREIVDGDQVFGALKASVEKGQTELQRTIQEKQKKTEEQAQDFIKQLEEEISELKNKKDQDINQPPPTKDWTQVRVHPPSYGGAVLRAVLRAAAQLEKTLREETKKLFQAELKRVQQYEVNVTLDPETAHRNLVLSEDGKQVYDSDVKKDLPDNPERFSSYVYVLGKQSISSGRFYFEVQVEGKTAWTLGVVRESITRTGLITPKTSEGIWCIWLTNGDVYEAHEDSSVKLSLRSPVKKVGVFVDYEEGLVSFHDIDSADLIHSFTDCSFTEKLFPCFNPCPNKEGTNSAPLIISPVKVK